MHWPCYLKCPLVLLCPPLSHISPKLSPTPFCPKPIRPCHPPHTSLNPTLTLHFPHEYPAPCIDSSLPCLIPFNPLPRSSHSTEASLAPLSMETSLQSLTPAGPPDQQWLLFPTPRTTHFTPTSSTNPISPKSHLLLKLPCLHNAPAPPLPHKLPPPKSCLVPMIPSSPSLHLGDPFPQKPFPNSSPHFSQTPTMRQVKVGLPITPLFLTTCPELLCPPPSTLGNKQLGSREYSLQPLAAFLPGETNNSHPAMPGFMPS